VPIDASRFGRPLPPGGTIGVPAPASPYHNRSAVLRSVEWWEGRGYRVKLADGAFERADWVAGDARSRARDLQAMIADPEVDLVQCLGGGFGSAQLLPHLDFDAIAETPKPFVGYSDITALHVALRQRAGLATFYGYGLLGMGDPETTEFTRERWLRVLGGDTTGAVPRDPDDPYVRAIAPGRAGGSLAGGCLWLLAQSMGTPWEVDLDDALFFFEDVDLPTWHLEGFLVQLRHAGKLERVAGVVVGQMEKCDWPHHGSNDFPRTKSVEDVLEEQLGDLGVPVLYGLPLGHAKHQTALPLGVRATLDADARTLTIDEPALRPS
jgi:muramoyltetrapeptide carboxypeptidase